MPAGRSTTRRRRAVSDVAEQFGESVKFVRQLQRRSQDDLAENLSVGRTSIANIESGKQLPTLATAVEIADELGTSLDWMIRRNVEPEPKPTQTWTALEALAHRITKGVNREIAEAQRRLSNSPPDEGADRNE